MHRSDFENDGEKYMHNYTAISLDHLNTPDCCVDHISQFSFVMDDWTNRLCSVHSVKENPDIL